MNDVLFWLLFIPLIAMLWLVMGMISFAAWGMFKEWRERK
jgi:hypothetical protein